MPADPYHISRPVKWTICAVAALGFLFDIYEILVAPLIIQPALRALGGLEPGTPDYRWWAGLLFWIPPLVGGFGGLWGGYFADRFGRRRILVWSILLYTVSAVMTGYATSVPMLLVFRTAAFAGVCVEFVAAVAWLAELFPEPRTREAVLGYTQMFSSLGGVLVSGAFYVANTYADVFPAIYGLHEPWRYTLISGVAPAIPLILVRPFLPESPQWARKRAEGTLKRPSVGELFTPRFRKTTLITTAMFACVYAAAFGTIQQSPQITPGLPEVVNLSDTARGQAVSSVQAMQEVGGMVGRFTVASLALIIVSRRKLLRLFVVPGLILTPVIFLYTGTHSLELFRIGIFVAGFTTVAQMNFWGNYLPTVYPVYLRGTGEGFAANVGGRMIGTSAAFIVSQLGAVMPGDSAPTQLAYAVTIIGVFVYGTALVLSFFMPEPPEQLPD